MPTSPELLAWAVPAGALATLNPCGTAMLPAYIAYFLGRDEGQRVDPLRGVEAGALLAAGVMTVFTAMGLLIAAVGSAIAAAIPWLALAVAVGLLAMGVATLVGHEITFPLPTFTQRAPRDRSRASFLAFGLGYGLASLGCTLPIFMIVVSSVLSAGFVTGVSAFVAYGFGMSVMLIAIAVSVAAGKAVLLRLLRAAAPALRYLGGLGLLAAGAYLVEYNLRGLQFRYSGGATAAPTLVAVAAGVLALAVTAVLAAFRRTRATAPTRPGAEKTGH